MMEERKRTFEGPNDIPLSAGGNQVKRLRPEDISGGRDEPGKAITRLLLNRAQFSRVIGKGGQTITHVRNTTGVFMKGSDISEEYRLVLLTGSLEQVVNAFEYISDLLHQAVVAPDPANPMVARPDIMSLHLLLEHSKAGKAVGSKGTMMQTIKTKSGAAAIRIEKEPLEVNGVSLRKLTIEGNLVSVRRAHMLVQELYVEPNILPATTASIPTSYTTVYSNMVGLVSAPTSAPPAPYNAAPPPYDPPTNNSVDSSVHFVPVPFPSLVNYGVQSETVRQLTEMKAYLWRHFGLDLAISREVLSSPAAPSVPPPTPAPIRNDVFGNNAYISPPTTVNTMGSNSSTASNNNNNINNPLRSSMPLVSRPTIESIIDARRAANPSEICFSIPKTCVGAIIGKGGQNLRELQNEYGVRVYIEKEDFNGKRMVVLSYAANPEQGPVDNHTIEIAVRNCQQQIEHIVEDQLETKSSDPSLENLSVQ